MAGPVAPPKRGSGGIVVLIIVVVLLCLLCCCVAGFLLIRQGAVSVPWENLPNLPTWIYSVFGRISQDLGVPGGQGLPGGEPGSGQTGGVPGGQAQPGDGPGSPGFLDPIGRGELVVDQIATNGTGFTGPALDVWVSNPTAGSIVITIPCGFIFAPEDDGLQQLMTVQEASAEIPANGEATVTPYVVCTQADRDGPEEGSSYSLGEMAQGDLLLLAQCVCGEELGADLDPMEGVNVQFAAWMAAEDMSLDEMLQGAGGSGGALGDTLGGEFGPEFDQILEALMALYAPAEEWLTRCGIQ
jgi:hypothetical protein